LTIFDEFDNHTLKDAVNKHFFTFAIL